MIFESHSSEKRSLILLALTADRRWVDRWFSTCRISARCASIGRRAAGSRALTENEWGEGDAYSRSTDSNSSAFFLAVHHYESFFQSLESSTTPSTSVEDVSRLRQELTAKDTRIVDLNNELIGKEHKIIELQESLRDARQLLETKNRAFTIVQQQLDVSYCKFDEKSSFSL